MDLHGKTVLATGATGGIGGALARVCASAGARLKVHGRDAARMNQLLAGLPAGSESLLGDLSTAEGRAALCAFAAAPNAADVVILNAASGHFGLFEEMSTGALEALIDSDLLAPMLLAHALLPILRQRPAAALVIVGSTLGHIGHPGFAAYGAAKGGLRTFTEALAREVGVEGPRVLWVSPRATRTAMNDGGARAMNAALKVTEDPPEAVATAVLDALHKDRRRVQMGIAEKVFVRINALLPQMVDRAMAGKLSTIRRYASRKG